MLNISRIEKKNTEKKKQEGGASVYMLGIYAILLLLLLGLYTIQIRVLNTIRDTYDSGLLLALIGTATVNVEEYGRTGQRVIHDTYTGTEDVFGAAENASCLDPFLEQALSQCLAQLRSNLELTELLESSNAVIKGPVTLEEFKIYNVYQNILEDGTTERQIYEFIWSVGSWRVTVHAKDEKVYVAGAGEKGNELKKVEDTALYAKISFPVAVFPYFQGLTESVPEEMRVRSVSIQRSVSVPQN